MVKFNAGTLSYPLANSSNFPLSVIKEYSKFDKLCKSTISNAKEKCFTAIGNSESVKITLLQCDSFFYFIPIFYFRNIDYSNSLK